MERAFCLMQECSESRAFLSQRIPIVRSPDANARTESILGESGSRIQTLTEYPAIADRSPVCAKEGSHVALCEGREMLC